MIRRFAPLAFVLVAVPSTTRAGGGPCPGTPLVCVGSGSQTLVVAVDLPARAVGVLVAGSEFEIGPSFGNGRLCVADPRRRIATTMADDAGTAVVRLDGRPGVHAGSTIQMLWRDRYSGAMSATSSARL